MVLNLSSQSGIAWGRPNFFGVPTLSLLIQVVLSLGSLKRKPWYKDFLQIDYLGCDSQEAWWGSRELRQERKESRRCWHGRYLCGKLGSVLGRPSEDCRTCLGSSPQECGSGVVTHQLSFLARQRVDCGTLIPLNIRCGLSTTASNSLQPQNTRKQGGKLPVYRETVCRWTPGYNEREGVKRLDSFLHCNLDYVRGRKISSGIFPNIAKLGGKGLCFAPSITASDWWRSRHLMAAFSSTNGFLSCVAWPEGLEKWAGEFHYLIVKATRLTTAKN